MMKSSLRIIGRLILTALVAVSLTACGGGESTNPPAENNEVPSATISSPSNNATFTQGDIIAFAGSASDPEDGDLSENSLVWTSDIDGQIGTGTSFSTTLSLGTHTITLTATDSQSATGTDSITVIVSQSVNQSPTATITTPSDGSTYTTADNISFSGTGTDPEDGTLTGSSLDKIRKKVSLRQSLTHVSL